MARSAAERKREQVQRERERAKSTDDLVYGLPRTAFGTWLEDHDDGRLVHLAICYDGMNRLPPRFDVESDPVSITGGFEFPTKEDGELSYRGSLGRAELEVELLVDAAKTLAAMINAYKRDMIESRIRQIEMNELDDREARADRLKEIVLLNQAIEKLGKSVRAELPQWQLRG
jgi:hypothetical protein